MGRRATTSAESTCARPAPICHRAPRGARSTRRRLKSSTRSLADSQPSAECRAHPKVLFRYALTRGDDLDHRLLRSRLARHEVKLHTENFADSSQLRTTTPPPRSGLLPLLADDSVSVTVIHQGISRVPAADGCDAMTSRLGARDPAVPVVIPAAQGLFAIIYVARRGGPPQQGESRTEHLASAWADTRI